MIFVLTLSEYEYIYMYLCISTCVYVYVESYIQALLSLPNFRTDILSPLWSKISNGSLPHPLPLSSTPESSLKEPDPSKPHQNTISFSSKPLSNINVKENETGNLKSFLYQFSDLMR